MVSLAVHRRRSKIARRCVPPPKIRSVPTHLNDSAPASVELSGPAWSPVTAPRLPGEIELLE